MKQSKEYTTLIIPIEETDDVYHALSATKEMAQKLGFSKLNQSLIATVTSELATNITRYADTGEIRVNPIEKENEIGIEIHAIDQGPGIENLDEALKDGFTTTPHSAGLGLSSLKRIMDDYTIDNRFGEGLSIKTWKWKSKNDN